jgi:FkbM family methyltransferase
MRDRRISGAVEALKRALESRAPTLAHRLRCMKQLDLRRGEAELQRIGRFVDREGVAIDAGANYGVYSQFFSSRARNVIAFEPVARLAAYLRAVLPSNVEVVNAALSDRSGETMIRIPFYGRETFEGASTIDAKNTLSGRAFREETATLMRLDDCYVGRDRVGFIKIDVEGHEAAVLRGADRILRSDRPNLLVEIADYLNPDSFSQVMAMMNGLGYRCYYCEDDRLIRMPLDPNGAERPGPHIYNYIFLATDDAGRLAEKMA